MKTSMQIKSWLAAAIVLASTALALAQTPGKGTAACPLGYPPGYGRTLTPEQRAEHQVVVQKMVVELRQKQANGTITAQEQAWLKQVEQRGGMCVNGTPRGCGMGKGPGGGNCDGAGAGRGQGRGMGMGCGAGPRSLNGTCPNLAPAK